ncbi:MULTISPECIES: TIGR02452 family protein [unclassified Pseudofrankia]|uniref:TIGR02452 family protein n=1 Tax=unclassified Pseudofrankia TaxID=2994372 RepID=UPI0008DA8D5C|nr:MULTISPECIES: TIGR02452 family protein [unclassified Pseudofrankia]MDT3440130.1 TIGR02452 family protein [Pseudofrankia sp. BMG5.37]OHV59573.1 TIGR02452 family protein [Pseudofrankia sp. BMG5.36]
MSSRLRAAATETVGIVRAGWYLAPDGRRVEVGELVRRAVAETTMYGSEPLGVDVPAAAPAGPVAIEVTGESSLAAARRLWGQVPEPVAVLNFASARRPGGGFLGGAKAQEEDLCRCSALHACLTAVPEFYEAHRARRTALYSDRVIHAPAVPVFRDDSLQLLAEPVLVGFLTAAAPNAGVIVANEPDEAHLIPLALRARSRQVLAVAVRHGYRRLVLGAWGCGVFRNDPAVVAAAFREHLAPGSEFADRFAHVVFAVLDRDPSSPTRRAFAETFA